MVISYVDQETQEVELLTQHDVGKHLVLSHIDVADGDTQAEDLLELELDGRADFGELVESHHEFLDVQLDGF